MLQNGMVLSVYLHKEDFKFSCSHFTIFGANSAECLHGHNYYVDLRLELKNLKSDLGLAFDFNEVKPIIRKLCAKLDERILIPQKSPYLKIKTGREIEVRFAKKRYVFPKEDVEFLPVVNITTEQLATYFVKKLLPKISSMPISSIEVGVQETNGQQALARQKILIHE